MTGRRSSTRSKDLEERLVALAADVVKLVALFDASPSGAHVAAQLVKSATLPAAGFAAARGVESKPEFVQKIKDILSELRATGVWLRIVSDSGLIKPASRALSLEHETGLLVEIFEQYVSAARKRGFLNGK